MTTKAKAKAGRGKLCVCPELPNVMAPGCEPKCPVHGEKWLPADVARTIREAEWRKNGAK